MDVNGYKWIEYGLLLYGHPSGVHTFLEILYLLKYIFLHENSSQKGFLALKRREIYLSRTMI